MRKKLFIASIIAIVVGVAAIVTANLLSLGAGLPDFPKGFIEGASAVLIAIGVFGAIKNAKREGKQE